MKTSNFTNLGSETCLRLQKMYMPQYVPKTARSSDRDWFFPYDAAQTFDTTVDRQNTILQAKYPTLDLDL